MLPRSCTLLRREAMPKPKRARSKGCAGEGCAGSFGRSKEKRAEVTVRSKEKEDEERGHIEESLAAIQDDFLKTLPALKDHESEAFKAGEREYNRHKALMAKMGPMGQMLAVRLRSFAIRNSWDAMPWQHGKNSSTT